MLIKSSKIHYMDFKIGYLRDILETENIDLNNYRTIFKLDTTKVTEDIRN